MSELMYGLAQHELGRVNDDIQDAEAEQLEAKKNLDKLNKRCAGLNRDKIELELYIKKYNEGASNDGPSA